MILFTHKVFSLSSSLSYILLFVMSNVSFIVYASSALKAERTAAETERKGKISEHTHVFLIKDIWKFLFGMEMVILGFFKVQEERYWYIVERKKRNKTTHRYGFSMHHQMEFIHFLLKLFCSQQFSLVIRHFPFTVVTASVFASSFDIMCCAYTSFQSNRNYVRHDDVFSLMSPSSSPSPKVREAHVALATWRGE